MEITQSIYMNLNKKLHHQRIVLNSKQQNINIKIQPR